MKTKIQIVLVALLLGTTCNLFAQDKTTKKEQKQAATPEQIAQKETERMTKDLTLTSDQQAKIQAINLKYAQQRIAAREKIKPTEEERKQLKEDTKKSMDAQDAEFKTVLTPEQYQAYLKKKSEVKEKIEKKVEEREEDKAGKKAEKKTK